MSRSYRLKSCVVGLLLICSQTLNAQSLQLSLKPFSKGNYLIKKGSYHQAAAHWHQLSILFMSNSQQLSQQEIWQAAGLAASLAAIAADKAQDPIAYQYWADSTRYLLTGGTNWSQIQQQLHQRFETANTQLSVAMQISDINAGIDSSLDLELNVLQVWDEKLALFEFISPKIGHNSLDTATAPIYHTAESKQVSAEQAEANTPKKLSGMQTNASRTPTFSHAPTTNAVQVEQPIKVNSTATGISAAAQQKQDLPTSINHNPIAKGNLSSANNPQVKAIQKRQIMPIVTEPSSPDKNNSNEP